MDCLSENGASRTTYVSRPTTAGWLRKLRKMAIETGAV